MTASTTEITKSVQHAISVLRRWWLLIAIGTVLAMALGTAASVGSGAHFVATSQVVVVQPAQLLSAGNEGATKRLADLMNTISVLGTSDAVLAPTRTAVVPHRSLADLRRRVSVAVFPGSLILAIRTDFPHRDEARDVADSVATQLKARLGTFAGSAAHPSTELTLEDVRAPLVQEVPGSLPRTLIVAFVLGFGFSVLAAFALAGD